MTRAENPPAKKPGRCKTCGSRPHEQCYGPYPCRRDEPGSAARREAGEETPADVPDNWVRRRVYKTSQEHSDYLNARFKDKTIGTFEYDGHRWRYEYTSFDDKGDYDVIVRPQSQPDAPPRPADDLCVRLLAMQHMDPCYPTPHPLCVEAAAAIEALRAERDAVMSLIPPEFLDPPDGGEVKPVELVRRVVAREKALEGALEKIANWKDFPATGKAWPSGNPISYGAENGFVGERDYMRGVAMQAIAAGGGNG